MATSSPDSAVESATSSSPATAESAGERKGNGDGRDQRDVPHRPQGWTKRRSVLAGLLFLTVVILAVAVAHAVSVSRIDAESAIPGVVGLLGFLLVCAIGGYQDDWAWTGMDPSRTPATGIQPGKTLWDMLQLLVVPLVLASIGIFFTARQEAATQQTSEQARQDVLLSTYLDGMTGLMKDGLAKRIPEPWTRTVARARTTATFPRLDATRDQILLRFIADSNLIPFVVLSGIDVHGADLDNANLSGAKLDGADLHGATMYQSNLIEAELYRANLRGAYLARAKLQGAVLVDAQLSNASLIGAEAKGAILVAADLSDASLVGAELEDADLYGTDFSGASLLHADLAGSRNLSVAIWHRTQCPDGTDSDNDPHLSCINRLHEPK